MATVFMAYPEEKLFWREIYTSMCCGEGRAVDSTWSKQFCAEERFMMFTSQELCGC